jgi:LemA protein
VPAWGFFLDDQQMDVSLLLWGAVALVAFWCVGLYNRLMRLRARAAEVLLALEKHALICADLVCSHVAVGALSGATDVAPEWRQVLRAAQNLDSLLRVPHPCELGERAIAPFSAGWTELRMAWQVAVDQQNDLAGPVVPAELAVAWDAASLKVRVVQGGYAQIVDRYNAAIVEFPARLVTRLFGFMPAGQFPA